jgi:crotonobetaine/carnitine-CoA ligase
MDRWAREKPEQTFVVFADGEEWTFAEFRDRVIKVATGLQQLGVARGHHVAAWLPNGREGLLIQFAINYLGAVFVPFNTAYRGSILQHVLTNSDASILVAHGTLVDRLADVNAPNLQHVVLVGEGPVPLGLRVSSFPDLAQSKGVLAEPDRPIEPWDTQSIIYTSGTTGPSKGVLSSYLHLYTNAGPDSWTMVTATDRFLVNMPLFHIGGMGLPFVMFARGGSIAMMESYSTDTFWEFVKQTQCTAIFLLGVMATFLMKRPPSSEDRDHKVRLALMVPLTDDAAPFSERFGIDVYTIFNMTEISSPIVSEANPTKRGTCGRPRMGVEVRLVDENDCEVPVGHVGEMILRTDRPWAMNSGYHKNPEATARAWRNGWFHTGDGFRRDEDGYFYFVDRLKDTIRRRGENISSFEVEAEIVAHPSVREAAVIGVPSELSEDEVMAVIAPVPGQVIDPAELVAFLAERMAYFMVPRYIRTLNELPKTPSAKVQKAALRGEGVTADTWDREAAGLRLRREQFRS